MKTNIIKDYYSKIRKAWLPDGAGKRVSVSKRTTIHASEMVLPEIDQAMARELEILCQTPGSSLFRLIHGKAIITKVRKPGKLGERAMTVAATGETAARIFMGVFMNRFRNSGGLLCFDDAEHRAMMAANPFLDSLEAHDMGMRFKDLKGDGLNVHAMNNILEHFREVNLEAAVESELQAMRLRGKLGRVGKKMVTPKTQKL